MKTAFFFPISLLVKTCAKAMDEEITKKNISIALRKN
jgi:hypothetical protein